MGEEKKYKLISKRIRLRRLDLGFSQEYMANQLNISQNIYSKNERHIRAVSLHRFLRIVELLDLNVVQVLENEN